MNTSTIYIAVSIAVLLVIAVFFFLRETEPERKPAYPERHDLPSLVSAISVSNMFRFLRRIAFNCVYLFRPPWDTGIPAPEVVRFIAGKTPGNVIDAGCGTGTNLLYLAQQNWRVTGIDFAPLAIEKAKRKLRNYPKTLLVADVTKLAELSLPGPFDLGLDMGCFHSLSGIGRLTYASGMERWIKSKGILMVYAFQPSEYSDVRGITREEMTGYFNNNFELADYEQGQGRPSAWYYFKRI